jgi:hypothetical protein
VTCVREEVIDEETKSPIRNADVLLHPYRSCTDEQAVEDSVLVPFVAKGKDTGHRITRNAYEELKRYHLDRGCQTYEEAEFCRFFLTELLPLVPAARLRYRQGGILTTNYDFRVSDRKHERVLWYLPNEKGGITIMKPEDY